MATKKQVNQLIKYSLNNDQEMVYKVAREIAHTEQNIEMTNKLNNLIFVNKNLRDHSKGGSSVEVSLLPDKDYHEYLYDVQYPQYTIDKVILPETIKNKVNNWIKELENLSFLQGFKLPLQTKAIFYGETGLGKTMTAYAIANTLGKPLLLLNLASIVSSKLGETSKNLNFVFQVAQEKEAIVFLDEIDFIALKRDFSQDHNEIRRSMISLMQILDLIPSDLIVIASTNMIDSLDPAIKRRFGLRIEFHKPTSELINKYLDTLGNEYNFTVNKSEEKNIIKYLSGNNYNDIKNIMLSTYKNILLHELKKRKEMIISLSDIKKYQSLLQD